MLKGDSSLEQDIVLRYTSSSEPQRVLMPELRADHPDTGDDSHPAAPDPRHDGLANVDPRVSSRGSRRGGLDQNATSRQASTPDLQETDSVQPSTLPLPLQLHSVENQTESMGDSLGREKIPVLNAFSVSPYDAPTPTPTSQGGP